MTGTGADQGHDDALRARLRALDPALSLPAADPARASRLLEATMSSTEPDVLSDPDIPPGAARRNRPLTWLVAAAAVAVIAGVALFAVLRHDPDTAGPPGATPQPSVTTLDAPAAGRSGRCMVPDPDVLAHQAVAFDGTVEAVSDGAVRLVPTHFYAGSRTDVVEVRAPSADLQALIGAVRFERGGRYLVSATDGEVTVCGYSGPYSQRLAALYRKAFPA